MRKAFISGRLGRDPEVRAPEGSEYSVLNFSVANDDEFFKNKQTGELENVTNWFDISFWTKNPQDWIRKMQKGTLVCVECDIKLDQWEQDGQPRRKIKFKISRGCYPIVMQSSGQAAPAAEPAAAPGGFPDTYDPPF